MKEYDGKVRVVFKNMVVHPQVAIAHYAGCAAGKQGKFKEFKNTWWEKAFKTRKMDEENINAIAKEIEARVPDIARLFDDGVFCEMCAALVSSPEWTVTIEKDWRSWRSTGPIYVTVGKARFRSEDTSFDDNSPEVERLKTFLEEASPLEEMVSVETPEAGLTP